MKYIILIFQKLPTVKIIGEDLNAVCKDIGEKLLKKNQFINEFGKNFDKEKVVLYFKKHLGKEIKDIVVFINVIDWYKQRKSGKLQDVIEFTIERTPCFEVLRDFALSEYNIALNQYLSLEKSNYFPSISSVIFIYQQ